VSGRRQALLISEIVDLSASDCARLLEVANELARFGLGDRNTFGRSAIAVREPPAILAGGRQGTGAWISSMTGGPK